MHPRFGRVRSLEALRPLAAGEEAVADYRYGLCKAPAWYRGQLLAFLTARLGLSASEAAARLCSMQSAREERV